MRHWSIMSLEGYYARMDSQLGIEKAITTRCIDNQFNLG
jgi:hypothetical protein